MEIKCTVEELRELLTNETSVAGTTDENITLLNSNNIISSLEKCQNYQTANCDKHEENHM